MIFSQKVDFHTNNALILWLHFSPKAFDKWIILIILWIFYKNTLRYIIARQWFVISSKFMHPQIPAIKKLESVKLGKITGIGNSNATSERFWSLIWQVAKLGNVGQISRCMTLGPYPSFILFLKNHNKKIPNQQIQVQNCNFIKANFKSFVLFMYLTFHICLVKILF